MATEKFTNLEYKGGERQRKRESRRQGSEARRENGLQRSRARDRNWSGGEKIRKARSHLCKVKMSGGEKAVNENTYNICSIKRVTKKFLEVSRCSRAKQRQRNVQKKCAARAKLLFC